MFAIPRTYDDYRFNIISAISPIVHLDMALNALGANPRRPPTLHAGSAPDILAWGVDSVVSAARLMLSGQIVGAAVMIRNQLERWMSRRAEIAGLQQQPGESTLAFAARTWTQPDSLQEQWIEKHFELTENLFEEDEDEPYADNFSDWVHDASRKSEQVPDHLHVYRSNGTDVCPALTYSLLSESIHLRAFSGAIQWDAHVLAPADALREDVLLASFVVCDAIFLVLREIRLSALRMAKNRGLEATIGVLSVGMDAISVSSSETDLPYEAIPFTAARMREAIIPTIESLAPLLPREGLGGRAVAAVQALALDHEAVLRRERPAGRLYQDDELILRSFAWHRRRSIETASHSLALERRMLGDEFKERSLTGRASRWVVLTEAASLLGIWHPVGAVGNAAAALASSLRSSYWLWLEDDDRAMAVLRSSLEYVATLRTWRRKPSKAESLTARSQTTPRDWITHAGWKRLSVLNQVLGEFAHARKMRDWPAARRLLAEMQLNVDPERAIFTARGAAIDFVASLAAREVVWLLSDVSDNISNSVARLLEDMDYQLDEDAFDVEAQFAHVWMMRTQQT
ncbi:hypothetical protein [Pseudonocardia sp.]|uniref:hypothetical protein n=1 Tax=Pseudonocardia sp. TaxID=60912 RepID=UPI002614D0CB|nr:hypothetical protein [Pseudonocardia sp.]